ncbi:MAG: ureidoglycolate lyase [Archangium sp.]|nr:ureidoglycolate lyase [Archangium sp.]MDP3573500.1 ureidoglycolate lyase [Archangium sp.]
MTPRSLIAAPLTAEAFAPFGRVVSAGLQPGSSANQGTAVRFDFCAELTSTRPHSKPNLAVFRSVAKSLPHDVVLLERHPCSTQVFIPMVVSRYLVCVAPTLPDGGPDLAGLKAFLCQPGQGVAYAPGTWHHPMVALDSPGEFTMLAWEDGTALDCEVRELAEQFRVSEA